MIVSFGSLAAINVVTWGICEAYKATEKTLLEFYTAFALQWAWADSNKDCLVDEVEESFLPTITDQKEPKHALKTAPWNNLAILAILIYQLGSRDPSYNCCVMKPNCSNYAIGMLRRYGLIYASIQTAKRVKICGQTRGFHLS